MGQARIQIAEHFVKRFLDLPSTWHLASAYVRVDTGVVDSGLSHKGIEEQRTLCVIVEGESIAQAEGADPVELRGTFESKVLDNHDGRWVQGHWEIYR